MTHGRLAKEAEFSASRSHSLLLHPPFLAIDSVVLIDVPSNEGPSFRRRFGPGSLDSIQR